MAAWTCDERAEDERQAYAEAVAAREAESWEHHLLTLDRAEAQFITANPAVLAARQAQAEAAALAAAERAEDERLAALGAARLREARRRQFDRRR